MKLIVVLCLVAVAVAAPPSSARVNYSQDNVQLISYENEILDGNYGYKYSQTDGTAQEQKTQILNEGREDETIAISGSFTWVGPDGVTYRVIYTADDDGYKPQIEQGPGGAVPAAVVASLLG